MATDKTAIDIDNILKNNTVSVMPHNLDAEKHLIGAILFNPEILGAIYEILKSDVYFYSSAHKKIYNAMLELYNNNEPIDAITLINCLNKKKELKICGGPQYIAEIVNAVTTISNAEYYARIIKEKYMLRSVITQMSAIIKNCYDENKPITEIINEAERSLFEIEEDSVKADYKKISAIVPDILTMLEKLSKNRDLLPGVPSGYERLDKITLGFHKSDFIILGARPSMGKTSFALNIAFNAAYKHKVPTLIFSLEMNAESIVSRLFSIAGKINQKKLRSGILDEMDWQIIGHTAEQLYETDIYIDNTYGIDPVTMLSKIRRLKSECPELGLVIIDYLQLMRLRGRRVENKQQEISEISRALKGIARDMNLPIIALSQLSRQIETRPKNDRRPQLSDLRESGAIEQDADLVMFIYRDEKYNPDTPDKNIAEILISKHRNGELGKVKLLFLEQMMVFENFLETEENEEVYE